MKIGDLVKAKQHMFIEWLGGYVGIVTRMYPEHVDVVWNTYSEYYSTSNNIEFLEVIAKAKEQLIIHDKENISLVSKSRSNIT